MDKIGKIMPILKSSIKPEVNIKNIMKINFNLMKEGIMENAVFNKCIFNLKF